MHPTTNPVKSNVCAVIVAYNPDGEFLSRLDRVAFQVNEVVIVDNGSDQNSVNILKNLSQTNVSVIFNNSNVGVASALNQGMDYATRHNYKWILTLDQDTIVEGNMIETFGEIYSLAIKTCNPAIIGSNFQDKLTGQPLVPDDGMRPWNDVLTVITSGTIVSLDAAKTIGNCRDDFFIDYLDAEYCLRAKRFNYDVLISRSVLMHHTIGSPRWHRLLWKRLITPHAPPLRRYYMSRNHIVLVKEYFTLFPHWIIQLTITRIKETVLILLFERDKFKKIMLSVLGIIHGIVGKMGQLGN